MEMTRSLNDIKIGGTKIYANPAKYDRERKRIDGGVHTPQPTHPGFQREVHRSSGEPPNVHRSFKEVLIGTGCQPTKTINLRLSEIGEPNFFKKQALVGEARDMQTLCNAKTIFRVEEIHTMDVAYIGGLRLLLKFDSSKQAHMFLAQHKDTWFKVFKDLCLWEGQELPIERIATLKIHGIPLQLRTDQAFNQIGNSFGKLAWPSEFSWKDDIVAYGVRVIEDDNHWLPDFSSVNLDSQLESEDSSDDDIPSDEDSDDEQTMENEQPCASVNLQSPTKVGDNNDINEKSSSNGGVSDSKVEESVFNSKQDFVGPLSTGDGEAQLNSFDLNKSIRSEEFIYTPISRNRIPVKSTNFINSTARSIGSMNSRRMGNFWKVRSVISSQEREALRSEGVSETAHPGTQTSVTSNRSPTEVEAVNTMAVGEGIRFQLQNHEAEVAYNTPLEFPNARADRRLAWKPKNIKISIKQWRSRKSLEEEKEISTIKEKIDGLELVAELRDLIDEEKEQRLIWKKCIAESETRKIKYLRQKSRQKWASCGDENTRYFHAQELPELLQALNGQSTLPGPDKWAWVGSSSGAFSVGKNNDSFSHGLRLFHGSVG
ncbi:hypothetical protein L1987_31077 [Smallanthus sonchifolius]|uniref:Uncharacterized protein n=1 Tax=Smallanthus sonchifolius TaxID=185202 RepID=A0ACB9I605_9ASTR|nr:hypothetical protein L1987_31077 [Smallanthus sonchifolius]